MASAEELIAQLNGLEWTPIDDGALTASFTGDAGELRHICSIYLHVPITVNTPKDGPSRLTVYKAQIITLEERGFRRPARPEPVPPAPAAKPAA